MSTYLVHFDLATHLELGTVADEHQLSEQVLVRISIHALLERRHCTHCPRGPSVPPSPRPDRVTRVSVCKRCSWELIHLSAATEKPIREIIVHAVVRALEDYREGRTIISTDQPN